MYVPDASGLLLLQVTFQIVEQISPLCFTSFVSPILPTKLQYPSAFKLIISLQSQQFQASTALFMISSTVIFYHCSQETQNLFHQLLQWYFPVQGSGSIGSLSKLLLFIPITFIVVPDFNVPDCLAIYSISCSVSSSFFRISWLPDFSNSSSFILEMKFIIFA